jgi:hypothetical protein
MTNEEEQNWRKLRALYPEAALERQSPWNVAVWLQPGVRDYLSVRKNGEWLPPRDEEDEAEATIELDNIHEVARFIHALVARYNALVAETNKLTQDIHLESLQDITSP